MKFDISKEECLRLAELEGDSEVGAGPTMDHIAREASWWRWLLYWLGMSPNR